MTTFTILPLFTSPDFSYSISLDGVPVNMRYVYNTRTTHYHLTVALRDGTEVITGQKLCMNASLTTSQMHEAGMVGYFKLIAKEASIQDTEASRRWMPDNFIFSYMS